MENFIKTKAVSADIVSIFKRETVCRQGWLKKATTKGLIFHSEKDQLLLNYKGIKRCLNRPVKLFLFQYELWFYGILKKLYPIEQKKFFEIAVGWTKETPQYYRECVEDLLN